jgi:hypothetical protein
MSGVFGFGGEGVDLSKFTNGAWNLPGTHVAGLAPFLHSNVSAVELSRGPGRAGLRPAAGLAMGEA